jgi:hypothetical protein
MLRAKGASVATKARLWLKRESGIPQEVRSGHWLMANSKIRKIVYVTDDSMAHLDPQFDGFEHNKFILTPVTFLRESPVASRGSP